MKQITIQVIGRLAAVAAVCLALGQVQVEAKPNVLFLFADDQCFETIGSLGLTDIDTPNLDRLASRGTQFSRAYNMGSWSGAVCVASRHMLITGRHIWRAQTASQTLRSGKKSTDEQKAALEKEFNNLWPQVMGRAGYQTFFTGKWHIQAPADKAFQVTRHIRGGMPKQTSQGYNRPLPDKPDPWSPYDEKFGGFWEGGKHWSEVVADDAVGYIGTAKKDERPFFMYIAFNAPHDPRQAPKEYVDRYPLSRIQVPENYLDEYPYKDAIGCSAKLRDEKLGPFPRTHHAVKIHRQEYYAIIEHMDAQIGRVRPGGEHLYFLHRRPWAGGRASRVVRQTESIRAQHARAVHRCRPRHQGQPQDRRADLSAGRDGHIAGHRRSQAPGAGRVPKPTAAAARRDR
jgi:choline-sulfatase